MAAAQTQVSRRTFLVLTQAAGAGLLLGGHWPGAVDSADAAVPFAPNPFVQVDPSGQITIWAPNPEIGQGVYTALPMIVAEELSVDLSSVKIVQADAGPQYGNQLVGGSMSVRSHFMTLRQAGTTARVMLVAAAAQRWGVDPSTCRAEDGAVVHDASKRRLAYGALAADAAKQPVPKDVALTPASAFKLLGKPTKRLDVPAKVDGTAIFGMDVKVPNMLYAVMARPPAFGGDIVSVDDTAARAVPGVKTVVRIPRTALLDYLSLKPTEEGTNYYVRPSVAVIADSTFAAKKGRDALKIVWKGAPGTPLTTAGLFDAMRTKANADTAWKTMRADGNVAEALAKAPKKVEAVYEMPLQAHAAMEPLVATAHVKENSCELWVPTQNPPQVSTTVAELLKIPVENVKVNVMFAGGGFGRKNPSDYVAEAVLVSKAVGAPVKLVWTREDDMRYDGYRQASVHKMTGGLDEHNRPIAWHHRMCATPAATSVFGGDGKDGRVFEVPMPDFPCYTIPNFLVDYTPHHTIVPIGFWRNPPGFNAFVIQSFVDELAAAAGKDPLAFRLEMIGDRGAMEGIDYRRLRGVLELAASKAKWGSPLPKGQGRGIAGHFSHGSYVALVAEVEVPSDGAVRVHKIVAAVDCGIVLNPLTVAEQVEGSIVFGLTQTLKSEITLKDGGVQQGNYNDFQMLRINEMPSVEVHIVPSTEAPTGMGEPATGPTSPAVTNAIFAATGKRVRKLPIRPADLKT